MNGKLMRPSQLSRLLSFSLALTFLYVNVLSASIPAGVQAWKERKQQKNGPSLLRKGLSELEKSPKRTFSFQPSLGDAFSPQDPQIEKIPSQVRSLPHRIARIKESYFPKHWRQDDTLVVHIQDVHENLEAQKKIADIIQEMTDKRPPQEKITKVGLEGAQGPLNFLPYRSFPDKRTVKDVAAYFLNKSFISGPEYLGITFQLNSTQTPAQQTIEKQNISFYGVEDRLLYLRHMKAFKEAVRYENELKRAYQDLSLTVQDLRETSLNPDLYEIEKAFSQYHERKIGLRNAIRLFTKDLNRKNIPIEQSLEDYKAALKVQERIQFSKLQQEARNILQLLSAILPGEELDLLEKAFQPDNSGQKEPALPYQFLYKTCQSRKIALKDYPNLELYFKYLSLTSKIRFTEILDDLDNFEKRLKVSAAQNEKEKEIIRLSADVRLLEKLIYFRFSPSDWEEYQKKKHDIYRIPDRVRQTAGSGRRSLT
ncbi:MAG: hypothetical protein HYY63_00505, partial [Elusimicrobia bacterium]|nr:hypothetical protein [Elusimicrobiota bacterium]